MEARLGADFSDVVVHTDADAAASAASVSARAYTVGNEVVFGAGSFAPETAEGRHRLAHELVHVEQQRRGPVSGTDGGRGLAVSSPSDALEQEAKATATRGLSDSGGRPASASIGRRVGLSARPTAKRPPSARPVTSRLVVQRDDGSPGISPPVDTRGFWDAVRAGDWQGAASTLVRFDAGTIENQVNALEVENLEPLKAASDRVNGVDAPKVRVPILDRQFTLAASSDRWNDAAALLNAFSSEDIKKRIDVMDPRWLAPLKAAADATLGDAAPRIRAPILRRWFWDALGSDYEGAARTLNAFSVTDIVGLVAKVPEDKLEPLKQASDRVNQGDPSGRIRTPILTRQYDAAVRDRMWVDAARHLNGFSPADVHARLEKLTPPQLDELRVGAHIAGLEALATVIAAFYSQLESDTGTSPIYDMSADPKTPGQINLDVHQERDSPRYIDNAATAVLVGIYLPGYFVYIAGLDKPIVVPWEYVEFSTRALVSESEIVHPSREEALKHVGDTAGATGGPAEFAFYRAAAGLTAPTVFSSATTPRIEQMALGAIRELGQSVSNELTIQALVLATATVASFAADVWASSRAASADQARASRSKEELEQLRRFKEESGASALTKFQEQARTLVEKLTEKGERVVVNMGGAGAPHEPPNAINFNNQVVGRKSIPNLIEADASYIGVILPAGSVDEITSFNMPPGTIDWARAAPGAFNVLKSGGKFTFRYRGANPEAPRLVEALQKAGFDDVQNFPIPAQDESGQFVMKPGDVLITARKP